MADTHYVKIAENIDHGPLTAPKVDGGFSPAFIDYLKLIFTAEQAAVIQHVEMPPGKIKTGIELAEASGRSTDEVGDLLAPLCAKGLLINYKDRYFLPSIPALINHHQHISELGPDDVEAARLYKKFFIDEGYSRYYQTSMKGTSITRVIPVRRTIEFEEKVLGSEEAHDIIDSVERLRLIPCPCRTRTDKLDERKCHDNNPIGSCITMGASAWYWENAGMGREVSAEEAKRYFDEMQEHGLVGLTDNYDHPDHSVICLCCTCCCSQTRGRLVWDNPDAIAPANFVAESNDDCIMCGACEDRCPFSAISMDDNLGRSVANAEVCMGCGVCTFACPEEALHLKRMERHEPLKDARELYTRIAIENRGGTVPSQ
jgi:Pyruvate/2-oxoacid:ferredoxin oxidoreductase delta subunit